VGPAASGEDGAAEAGAGVVGDDGVEAEAWGLSACILEGIPSFLIWWGSGQGGGEEVGGRREEMEEVEMKKVVKQGTNLKQQTHSH
jgi:hypothetical protein